MPCSGVTLHSRRHTANGHGQRSIYRISSGLVWFGSVSSGSVRFGSALSVARRVVRSQVFWLRTSLIVYLASSNLASVSYYCNKIRSLGFKLYSLGTETYGNSQVGVLSFGLGLFSIWVSSDVKHRPLPPTLLPGISDH